MTAMHKTVRVTFEPSGRTVYALGGTRLLEVAVRAGLLLRNPCGGLGTCGKCRVRVSQGHCAPTDGCRNVFTGEEIAAGWRLACQAVLTADCVIAVPAASLFESASRILTDGAGEVAVGGVPALRKRFVTLPKPDLEDPMPDWERLTAAIGPHEVSCAQLARLSRRLRDTDFQGTVVTCNGRFVDWEAGHTEDACHAVAFDLGTTTIVGTLLNTAQTRELAVQADMNPQIAIGDDVISRISLARSHPERIAEMQAAVVATFNELIGRMCRQAGVSRDSIYEVSVAGNTTMQHLFCGLSPAALGEVPFVPACRGARAIPAADLGLEIHDDGCVYVFPNIGGFVGGDTVAGILANGVHLSRDTVLFVDIGTNGEIVLAHQGKLLATSCAAGPAFEGARIVAGMRAAEGAIDRIAWDGDDLTCNVIGGGKAAGICGTALIDAVAVLLNLGIIDETGRILGADELPVGLTGPMRLRLQPDNGDIRVVLAHPQEARSAEAICLYQRDVRELQLASGAIRAGIVLMLAQAGITAADLKAVLLAGGFGNYIRRENACRIGLLPDLPLEIIRFVGNASSAGAKAVLFSAEQRREAERIAGSARHVDLSLDPAFQMEFGMAMLFPAG